MTAGTSATATMHYDNLNKQEIKDLLICFLFIVNNLSDGELFFQQFNNLLNRWLVNCFTISLFHSLMVTVVILRLCLNFVFVITVLRNTLSKESFIFKILIH